MLAALLATAPQTATAQVSRISYGGSDAPAQWRLGEQRLALSSQTGPTQFWMITGVLVLGDGAIAVADNGSSEIRIFEPGGRHRRTLGGAGRGPGEFNSLWSLWRAGETVIGVDASGRSHTFTADGQVVASDQPTIAPTGQRLTWAGHFSDGARIAYHSEPVVNSPAGEWTGSIVVYRQRDGALQRVGRYPGRLMNRRGNARPTPVVYGPRAHIAVLADSYCVGYSEQYTIRCFDRSGSTRFEVSRSDIRQRAVAEADRELFYAGIDAANPGPRGEAYRREVRQTTVFATRMPAHGRLVAASNNELWVGPVNPGDDTLGTMNPSPTEPGTWSIFSARGEWVAQITLPARFRLMDAGRDYVAGVTRDINDVESVVVYALRRR